MVVARLRAVTKESHRLEIIKRGLLAEVITVMQNQIDDAVKEMQTEPPLKAGSNYIRTHTYSRSWAPRPINLTKEGLVGGIDSDAVDPYGTHYSELVGGSETGIGQLDMHRNTGWPLAAEALRGGAEGLSFRQKLRRAIHSLIEG